MKTKSLSTMFCILSLRKKVEISLEDKVVKGKSGSRLRKYNQGNDRVSADC